MATKYPQLTLLRTQKDVLACKDLDTVRGTLDVTLECANMYGFEKHYAPRIRLLKKQLAKLTKEQLTKKSLTKS